MSSTTVDYDIGHIERQLAVYGIGGFGQVTEVNAKGEAVTAKFGQYTVRYDSGIVDVNHGVILRTPGTPTDIPWVGVQFGLVQGDFNFGENLAITSLQGVPRIIQGRLACERTLITNFSGIDKLIDRMGGQIYIRSDSTHLLGLLLVPGLGRVNISNGITSGPGNVEQILNKYINRGKQDILSAQDELLDAGFIEQARL